MNYLDKLENTIEKLEKCNNKIQKNVNQISVLKNLQWKDRNSQPHFVLFSFFFLSFSHHLHDECNLFSNSLCHIFSIFNAIQS